MNMQRRSALEKLAKKLDSRTARTTGLSRAQLSPRTRRPSSGWQKGEEKRPRVRGRRPGYLEFFFIISVIFFVAAGAFTAYLFFSGSNTVSTRNVVITIDGPTEVRAGESLPLSIVITNRNSVPMELTDLVVEFPRGTRSEADVTVELPRIRESLGMIYPGESVNRTIRAVLFGSAGTTAEIKVSVEYRVQSSNAIFVSEGKYAVPISQSPASITVESLEEVVSGQETALTVTITSNVADVLSDMLLVAEYPPGFSFRSATPVPSSGSNIWKLGDIAAGGTRTITIRGVFSGEDGDERVVHFTAGTQNGNLAEEIAAPLAAGDATLKLAKPFISLSLSLDGKVSNDTIVRRGEPIRGDIRWVNNLPNRVQDVEIEVSLSGGILDRSSVVAQKGFWSSSAGTIAWSRETDSALADVSPGASGVYTFSFATQKAGTFKNPELTLTVTVRGRRIAESQVPESIESSIASRIVVSSDLVLQPALTHVSGPLPPRADQETTYLVSWTATNSVNAVANASVSAALPSYVRFVPDSATGAVSYNAIGGVVTWNIGDIEAGASKTATFQVSMTPSLSQVGQSPTIVSDQRVYGVDRFTREAIERIAASLSTKNASAGTQEGTVAP